MVDPMSMSIVGGFVNGREGRRVAVVGGCDLLAVGACLAGLCLAGLGGCSSSAGRANDPSKALKAAGPRAACLRRVAGTAQWGYGSQWKEAASGFCLPPSAVLRSGPESRALLEMGPDEDMTVGLGRSTMVKLGSMAGGGASGAEGKARLVELHKLELRQGLLYVEVPDGAAAPKVLVGPYGIRPGSKSGAEGAELLVAYGGDVVQVSVARGVAALFGAGPGAGAGAGSDPVEVRAGESIMLRSGSQPVRKRATSFFEDTRWVRTLRSATRPAVGRLVGVSLNERGGGSEKGAVPDEVEVEVSLRGPYAVTTVSHVWGTKKGGAPKKGSVFEFAPPRRAVMVGLRAGRSKKLVAAKLERLKRAGGRDERKEKEQGGGGARESSSSSFDLKDPASASSAAGWRKGREVRVPLGKLASEKSKGSPLRVEVSYAQALTSHRSIRRYSFPLGSNEDLKRIGRFCFRYSVAKGGADTGGETAGAVSSAEISSPYYRMEEDESGERQAGRFCEEGFSPSGDVVLTWMVERRGGEKGGGGEGTGFYYEPGDRSGEGVRYGLFSVRVGDTERAGSEERVGLPGRGEHAVQGVERRLMILVDTSRSLIGAKKHLLGGVRALLDRLSARDRFMVVALGSEVAAWKPDLRPAAPAARRAAYRWVEQLELDGPTDLARSLEEGAKLLPEGGQAVYLGDGVSSLVRRKAAGHPGDRTAEVGEVVRRAFSGRPLHVIGLGRGRDGGALRALAGAGGGSAFLPRSEDELAQAAALVSGSLWRDTVEGVRMRVFGVSHLYPEDVGTVSLGDEVVGVFRIESGKRLPQRVVLGGRRGGRRWAHSASIEWRRGDEVIEKMWADSHLGHKILSGRHARGLVASSRKLGVLTPVTTYRLPEALVGEVDDAMVKAGRIRERKRWAFVPSFFRILEPGGSSATLDSDNDSNPDLDDECPHEPETVNGFQDDDGCPDSGKVEVGAKQIKIKEKIFFDTRKATIREESFGLLDAIASTVTGHPSIRLVEIAGHTDERKSPGISNKKLSLERAKAVRKALIERGVEGHRLEATGYGSSRPLDKRHNEEAWAKNRRVEFLIVRRKGQSGKVRDQARAFEVKPGEGDSSQSRPKGFEGSEGSEGSEESEGSAGPAEAKLARARKLARAGKRAGWLDWVEGLRRAGKVELAWKKAEAWRELDPLNLGVYRLAGELASAAGKVEEAREAFWDIVELAPHQPEALRLTGAMFLRAGDQEEAAHLYRLAHRARPADPCYGLELAELLIDQKKHNRALQILGGIESLYSGRQPLLAVRAKRLLDELASKRGGRRRVRAIRQLRRMLRLALPDDVPLVMSLEWDPLLGPLELAVITPDGRRISRARSWGRYGERFHSACHAMSSIRIPQPQKGTYRVEASLPADYGDRVVEGKLRIQTNKGRRSKRQAVSFRLERAATAETIARIIAR